MGMTDSARIAFERLLSGTGRILRGFLLVTAFPAAFHGRRGIVTARADNEKPGAPPALLFPMARPAALALRMIRLPLRPGRKPVIVPVLVPGAVRAAGRSLSCRRPLYS